ncbi:putative Pectin lyase-like superfamily protein [Hibiscus syriacus]|uniref:Pectin lyase-like superfamily protein n=1 Tax=Hibiscus syriacus TaxID=106335 RepID=A0A6A3BBJ2_HIBSY|nr:VQ motif-containing protein 1-like [Hibiscus syriacus]KAE8712995.1 putative Pectin lyase-like superfamily protein [Hibiscus syriacus]
MSNGGEPVKVVIINTKYVETDATSFKSVVQELTGKDSVVTSDPPRRRSRFYHEEMNKKEQAAGVGSASSRSGESVLVKNLSFKKFERLLKEMPPADDLWWRME